MTDLSAFRPVPLWQRMVAAGLASLLIPFGAAALMVGILSILTGGTDPEALRGAELSPPIAALILSVQFLSFASSMAWLGYMVLIPITLRTVDTERQDISKLDGLSIYSQTRGAPVPLKQVADIRLSFEPGIIEVRII